MGAELLVRVGCTLCGGTGVAFDTHEDIEDDCGECGGTGDEYYHATPADIVVHVAALPEAEAVALLADAAAPLALRGPKPWHDGDERCHCTHCESCGRLFRSVDIGTHREVCIIRQICHALAGVPRG